MTTKAVAEKDWMRDLVRIAVRRELGSGAYEALVFPDVGARRIDIEGAYTAPPDDQWLNIREDDARAIYEALADHFGHSGHDTRALRRDYDDERARVDKLIGNLIGGAR